MVTGKGITAVGLDYDPRTGYLFVAGGASGKLQSLDCCTEYGPLVYKRHAAVENNIVAHAITTKRFFFLLSSFGHM